MSEKPSYLGLLNSVAIGEIGGERLFDAWVEATPNDDVRTVLQTVALREAEHARSFAKRINELGYAVRQKEDPDLPRRVAIASSPEMSDCEKFERLGFARPLADGPDIFARFFEDTSIDIPTGELLGRFISEERDTARRLRACHAALAADAAEGDGSASSVTSTGSAAIRDLSERLERIECALATLVETKVAATEPLPKRKADSRK